MKLIDLIREERNQYSLQGMKIPWNNPEFSRRMLVNHLSQEHDWASRRKSLIDLQAEYVSSNIPTESRVLDLGCGPGLYLKRLAALGHCCTGVDFSPASIDYARKEALEKGLNITYELEDVRVYEPGGGFDAVLILFGEINVFSYEDALLILRSAFLALKSGGLLFLEAHSFAEVMRQGLAPRSWESFENGLFSDKPHLCLTEGFWNGTSAVTRYMAIDAETAKCSEYASCMRAYRDEDYRQILLEAGFSGMSMIGEETWPVGEDFAGKIGLLLCEK